MNALFTLALIHALGVASPGQDFIAITSHTLKNGFNKTTKKLIFGVATGQAVYIFLSLFGIMEIILGYELLATIFYFLSGLYLVYLCLQLLKSKQIDINVNNYKSECKSYFKRGFMVTIANPKAAIFYSSILVNFIPKGCSVWYILLIGLYMSIATFSIFTVIAFVFNILHNKIIPYLFILEKIFGMALGYYGISLLCKIII